MTDRPPDDRPTGDRPTEDLVGRTLAGKYRIVRRLGEGAMGSVYLGEHLRFGRKDAIKVLQASMARDPEATRRFLRGARNVSAINHRNVCTVYDFGDTEDGHQFLAMEFVDGEALSDTLEREGALPVARAVHIAKQVASALQAAHDQGIVHRDLKPGNIMLTRDRDGGDLVKVVDFDIAKGSKEGEGGEVTRMGFVVGTPEYMSPEQLTGDPLDGRSDVYSLGLVSFRLLTGRLPMRSTSTQDLLVERLTQDPLTLREVAQGADFPPGLQAVLDRALQRKRDDRHATAMDFARELEAALGGADVPVASPRTSTPAAAPGLTATGAGPAVPSPEPAIPATRVTDPGRVPAPSPAPGASASTSSGGAGSRRVLAWGLGAVALAVASWAGYAALSGGGTGPSVTPGTGGGVPQESSELPVVVEDDPGDTGGSGGGGADPVSDPDDPVDTDRPEDRPTDPPDRDPPPEVEAPPATLPFPLAEAEDVAFRQLESLDAGAPVATLRAGVDTVTLIVGEDAVPRSTRAYANFILGQLHAELGDTAAAIAATERAVDLDPDSEPFRNALAALRGGRP